MSVKIRLSRMGAKKQPTYRIVIAEERSKRDGRLVERIGHYDPRTDPPTIVINEERTRYWLGVGARPTDALGIILRRAGISDKYVREHTARKSKSAKAEAAAPAAAPAPAPAAPPAEG
ncbi:MAG: 30S ribosomal protein S16 [Chloroflexi bacterium RBG_16_56_8]|nr:MAG: 30S ribosomal protein S16 [Chloroflexi bacterium RBG_16_56_8]